MITAVHARRGSARLHEWHRPRGGRGRHRHHRAWHHVGTNALLERKVARTGIITTAGFRDVLEMRRRDRPQTSRGGYEPVVPRDLRLEVDERVLADGAIHTEVNVDQVEAAARELLARGCEAVCVFFVNAYANPERGPRGGAGARDRPNGHVTATEVLPEIREFERCSTATLNAALTGGGQLPDPAATGPAWPWLRRRAAGGAEQWRRDVAKPPRRAGAHGAVRPAAASSPAPPSRARAGLPDVVTGDMGGTSFDVAGGRRGLAGGADRDRVRHGGARADDTDRDHRRGGGGSIASVDAGGLLGRSGIGRQVLRRVAGGWRRGLAGGADRDRVRHGGARR